MPVSNSLLPVKNLCARDFMHCRNAGHFYRECGVIFFHPVIEPGPKNNDFEFAFMKKSIFHRVSVPQHP
jgi:hypothetical protein